MISWRSIIISILSVLLLTTVAVPALAGEESGTETIMGMDPFSISFENTGSDPMKVSWDITVTDGVPINIVLLDEENYGKFTSYLRYEAYEGHQYNYTNSSKRTVNVDEGKYYLVLESAHSSMDSSTVRYEVTWGEDSESSRSPWCWPAAFIVALIAAVIAALFGRGRIGTRSTMRASADAPPVRERAEMAELSPQPEPPDMPADATRPTGEGATQLSPQPEPPDAPAPHEMVRPTGEGTTQLGPQPEPPDHPLGSRKPPGPGTG